MSAPSRNEETNELDISRTGVSWLDIKESPPPDKTWLDWLRTLRRSRQEFNARFIAWRFSYEMAQAVARDPSMFHLFGMMDPIKDWAGWFPNRLMGCPCYRESRPGSIFKHDQFPSSVKTTDPVS